VGEEVFFGDVIVDEGELFEGFEEELGVLVVDLVDEGVLGWVLPLEVVDQFHQEVVQTVWREVVFLLEFS
jgi:hypothetical protein